jgi:uncharacterized membrane protein
VSVAVSFTDWLLALHLLAAFALIAALVLFTAVMVANWGGDRPQRASAYFRLAAIGGPLIAVGAGLTLVLGIWLAIDLDAYQPWDGWIIASIVLWAIGGATGSRVGAHYTAVQELVDGLAAGGDEPNRELAAKLSDGSIRLLHATTVGAFAAVLVLMIFKPGA